MIEQNEIPEEGEIRIVQSEKHVFLARIRPYPADAPNRPYKYCGSADGDEVKSADEIRQALEKPIIPDSEVWI